MIISPLTRPVSVKSLAGSPIIKPEECSDNIEEELRSINNDLPPADFDFGMFYDPLLDNASSFESDLAASPEAVPSSETSQILPAKKPESKFPHMPFDIHEMILGHFFGPALRVTSSSATLDASPTSWSKAPRFSRRKKTTDLALVCRPWAHIVQARLYRQIEVKGTNSAILECRNWFLANPHLLRHVRLVSIWIPVWGKRSYTPLPRVLERTRNHHKQYMSRVMGWEDPEHPPYDIPFLTSEENSTMEEIFLHMQLFTSARILILQGGHANTSPEVNYFRGAIEGDDDYDRYRSLPKLPQIETFVMRGAWNLVRRYRHWINVSRALPNLRELHFVYPTARSDVDLLVAKILNQPPGRLRHLNLNIEGTGIGDDPAISQRLCPEAVCTLLGQIAFYLETFSFTGKVCHLLFETLKKISQRNRWPPRLKSLDLSVLSCCPDRKDPNTSPNSDPIRGIDNLKFINAFEKIVIEAVKCLEFLPALTYLNIRFLDISPFCPQVKPYFTLTSNQCTGLWSDEILDALRQSRPMAQFVELSDGIHPEFDKEGAFVAISPIPRRPSSINARMYAYIVS